VNDMSEIKEIKEIKEINLIEVLKEVFRETPLSNRVTFEDIEVFNKDKKDLLHFIAFVIDSFAQASNGYIKIKRYAIPTNIYFKITTTYTRQSDDCTILDFLQMQNPDINFCESKDFTTKIYFEKIHKKEKYFKIFERVLNSSNINTIDLINILSLVKECIKDDYYKPDEIEFTLLKNSIFNIYKIMESIKTTKGE
jgi:hypothetical protein